MGKGAKTKGRRKRVRRHRAESTVSLWERFRRTVGLWPTFMFVVFAVVASAVALYGRESLGHSVGEKIRQPIWARVDFDWVNEAQTEERRQAARAAAPTFYGVNHQHIGAVALAIQTLYQDAKAAETYEAFAAAAAARGQQTNQALFAELRQLMTEEGGRSLGQWVENLRGRLQRTPTIRIADARTRQPPASGPTVRIVSTDPNQPEIPPPAPREVNTVGLYPISNAEQMQRLGRELAADSGFPVGPLQTTVRDLMAAMLQAEPLLQFDKVLTDEAMQQAAADVRPAVISFNRGQPIISPAQAGEDLVLGPEHLALLRTEAAQYRALLASNSPEARPLQEEYYLERAGNVVIIVLLSLALFVHAGLYQRRILDVRTRTIALVVLMLGMLLGARLIDTQLQVPEATLVPAIIVAACLTIAYPRRFALGTTGIVALLVVQTTRGDIGQFVMLLGGLSLTVYLLNDIRARTQIITAGLGTAGLVFVISFAFGLINRQALEFSASRAGIAAGSTIVAALVVQGLLPFIERAFRIATSLTLLEWSVADKPLLQRLAREAPGTYNHCLVLGTMAQAACEVIGANGLLVRVGALYHDIGKIHKADYFAENQEASISRHANLPASMSLLIILGHVKDGIELAKEYGLPRVLHQFIAEHHGTTVVRYFHHKASEKQPQIASGKHDREVPETEFRYPGPRPSSKESAVLMICDGVEGAVRALPEPTAGRIESVVHQVLMDRLNDGQFGDCDITLKQLQLVEDSLVKSLCTFYHGRVTYPKPPGPGEDAAPVEPDGPVEARSTEPPDPTEPESTEAKPPAQRTLPA